MLVTGGLADHWPDIVVTALIATLGYLGRDRLRSMDARHQRAEDKFEEHDDQIAALETKVAVLEVERTS